MKVLVFDSGYKEYLEIEEYLSYYKRNIQPPHVEFAKTIEKELKKYNVTNHLQEDLLVYTAEHRYKEVEANITLGGAGVSFILYEEQLNRFERERISIIIQRQLIKLLTIQKEV
jgi:hypothetical protein